MIREAPPPTVVSHTGATHPEGTHTDNWATPSGPKINSTSIDRASKQHDICIRE